MDDHGFDRRAKRPSPPTIGRRGLHSALAGAGDGGRFVLHELNREESAARAPDALVVVPIGATEQHGPHLPGHAGVFETSLMLALRPELVAQPLPHRDEAELARVAIPRTSFRAERAGFWESIDGFTDSPDHASAETGRRLLETMVPPVADAFAQFARLPLAALESLERQGPTPESR